MDLLSCEDRQNGMNPAPVAGSPKIKGKKIHLLDGLPFHHVVELIYTYRQYICKETRIFLQACLICNYPTS
jgi:hypothetical protein